MSLSSLTYAPPIRRSIDAAALDYQLLETATELFESGHFLESTQKVFEHLFPGQPPIKTGQTFSFVQGSSKVAARIEGDQFSLTVPLVQLPAGGGAVAALRYTLSRINGSGQLHQARLRGEALSLEFSDKLSALHPHKLLEVLRRMPIAADQHDDWMIAQFGAIALERGNIDPLSDGEFARAEQIWRMHWNDVEELLKEAQRKRSMFFINEVTAFAINRIRFSLPLGGSVSTRLAESASTFNNCDIDPMKRESVLSKCIKEMRAVSSDELRKNLGHVRYAISPLADGTQARLTGFFGPSDYMETIDKYRAAGQSLDAALPLVGTYYYLLANFAWPREVQDALKGGLAEVSGKPMRDTANALFSHARNLVEQFGVDDEEEDEEEGEEDDEDGDGEDSGGEKEAAEEAQ